jgi:hypothetical protein
MLAFVVAIVLACLYWLVEKSVFRPFFAVLMIAIERITFHPNTAGNQVRRVMVYSPNLGGHRHIYCKRFIDFFRNKDIEIYFVFCGNLHGNSGNYADYKHGTYTKYETNHIDSFKDDEYVHMIDISSRFRESSELDLIVSLQRQYGVSLTLFIDGDILKYILASQILLWKPELVGKNYAVFIKSEFIYSDAPLYSYCRYIDTIFHLLLFKRFSLLDGGFYADENIVSSVNSKKYIHLPEVGNAKLPFDEGCQEERFYTAVRESYLEFLQQHCDRDVILAFGDLEQRKGFDFLLRLVSENENLVLVRVGRIKPGYSPDWDSVLRKEKLIIEDRIFELDIYVENQRLFDTLFQSTKYILLPYKDFYRTSSVMIQALSYGKPILVPDTGLIKDRVEQNGLGRTFKHLSYESFFQEYIKLQSEYWQYTDTIETYIQKNHSREAFSRIAGRMLS